MPVDDPPDAPDLAALSDAQLLEHLHALGDGGDERLVAEFRARGARMVRPLARLITRERLWRDPGVRGWAPLHGAFLLGDLARTHPAREVIPALVTALRLELEVNGDLLADRWPDIMGALGPTAVEAASEVLHDPSESDTARMYAATALAAGVLRGTVAAEAVRPRLRALMQDPHQIPFVRESAASALLDIAHPDDRADLERFADWLGEVAGRTGVPSVPFDRGDVDTEYDPARRVPPTALRDWLDRYGPDAVAARARRDAQDHEDADWAARADVDAPELATTLMTFQAAYAATLADLPAADAEAAEYVAHLMMKYAVYYEAVAPWRWDFIRCGNYLRHHARSGSSHAASLAQVPDHMLRFVRWWRSQGRLGDAEVEGGALAVKMGRDAFLAAASDPAQWGPAKQLVHFAREHGFDPTTSEGLAAAQAVWNATPIDQLPGAGRTAFDDDGDWDDSHADP